MTDSLAEQGVTAAASVVPGLGYPNNRLEESASPTGWLASKTLASGTPDQSNSVTEKIQK